MHERRHPSDFRIAFFGTPQLSVPCLSYLVDHGYHVPIVVTQPDRPVGRSQTTTPSPVKQYAQAVNIPVLQPTKIDAEFMEILRDAELDIALVVAYGKILPTSLLAIPRHGFLNIHPSLLPELRGASPIPYAILTGLARTGLTLQKIAPAMDEGDVYGQLVEDVYPNDTTSSLSERIEQRMPELLDRYLLDVLEEKISATPQDPGRATYTKILQREHGHLDWNASATEIERRIRAFTPWPGTYAMLDSQRLKLLRASLVHGEQPFGITKPGTLHILDNRLFVECADQLLELLEVQPEGKSVMPVDAFTRGYQRFDKSILS